MAEEYKLLRGTHRTADGSLATQGDVVELTERQTEQFNMEKFERVIERVEASGEVPDDWATLRNMGVVYEGDEVNGSSKFDELQEFFEDELSDREVANLKEEARDRMNEK